jgi:hypothetical protein
MPQGRKYNTMFTSVHITKLVSADSVLAQNATIFLFAGRDSCQLYVVV